MEKLLSNVTSKVFEAFPDKQPKDFYLCSGATIDMLANQITPASPNFGLLLAMDSQSIDDAQIGSLAGKLVDKGLVYLCPWGPDCERVHDDFDGTMSQRNPEPTEENVIMTTSHSDESLEEAIWFFVNCAFPVQTYEKTCRDWIVAPIGNREWEQIIRSEFQLIDTDRTA